MSVATIDSYAEHLFANPDPELRRKAEAELLPLIDQGSDGAILMSALQQSSNQYTFLFVAQGLTKWFKANSYWLDNDRKRDVVITNCGECVKRLATWGFPRHVVLSMMSCYARLTKLCFFNDPLMTEAVDFVLDMHARSQPEDNLHFSSLVLMSTIVGEFSRYDTSKALSTMTFAMHRRCSNNFRDERLLHIFQVSLEELKRASVSNTSYLEEVINLVHECLGYDFMAIRLNETEESLSTQFPTAWKDILLSENTQRILWGQHAVLPYPYCATLLTALSSLCGIRRTFFESVEQRIQYLDGVLQTVMEAAAITDGRLKIPHYVTLYAEACTRFISPFGYRDMHRSKYFEPWLRALRAITLDVFAIPFGKDGSFTTATTLLNFWRQLVTSRRMYSTDDNNDKYLEYITPELVITFFKSRVRLLDPPHASTQSRPMAEPNGLVNSSTNTTAMMNESNTSRHGMHGNHASSVSPAPAEGGASALGSSRIGTPALGPAASASSSSSTAAAGAAAPGNDSSYYCYSIEDDDDYDGAVDAMLTQSDAFAEMSILNLTAVMEALAHYLSTEVGPRILMSVSTTAWLFFMAADLERRLMPHIESNAVAACSTFFSFCVDCVNHRRLAGGRAEAGDVTFPCYLVERAVLNFLDQIQCMLSSSRLTPALTEVVNNVFQSRVNLFQFVLNSTGHNLLREVRGNTDEEGVLIIRTSLELIRGACQDISPSVLRELSLSLPPVTELPLAQSTRTYKLRSDMQTVLYPLCMTLPYDQGQLEKFLQPIMVCMRNTLLATDVVNSNKSNNGVSSGSGAALVAGLGLQGDGNTAGVKDSGGSELSSSVSLSALYVAGWLRDLRGVCRAVRGETEAFADFADWCLQQFDAFRFVLAGPAGDEASVLIAFLHFFDDILSHCDRDCSLTSDHHSVFGLRIFKQVSAYIQQIVERCITDDHIENATRGNAVMDGAYDTMLKPLMLCMRCLRSCVHGGYVPFGAMTFYQDNVYENTLLGLLRMLAVFPVYVLKEYDKVPRAITALLRVVVADNCYRPLAYLAPHELRWLVDFVSSLCEDSDTSLDLLRDSMHFLAFVSGFVKDAPSLSQQSASAAGTTDEQGSGNGSNNNNNNNSMSNNNINVANGMDGGGSSLLSQQQQQQRSCTPLRTCSASSQAMPSMYLSPGTGRISGTPADGGGAGASQGYGSRSKLAMREVRMVRMAIAHILDSAQPPLWPRLITVAMSVMTCRERFAEPVCEVVYPILEVYPPFWYDFVDVFVRSFAERKQAKVKELLSNLTDSLSAYDTFARELATINSTLASM